MSTNLRQPSPQVRSPELWPADSAILAAANYAYELVSARENLNKSKIHQLRVCAWVTRPMRDQLRSQGYGIWTIGRLLKPGLRPHIYLIGDGDEGTQIADAC